MTHQRDPEAQAVAQELKQQIMILGLFLASFWGLEISDQFVFQNLWRGGLDVFGILPDNCWDSGESSLHPFSMVVFSTSSPTQSPLRCWAGS